MNDHPFEIHSDGSVSYDGKTYEAEAVQHFIKTVKDELDQTEFMLGSFAGHQVKLRADKPTHLQIGCQAFRADYIKAFIEDYEARCADLMIKLGDRLIGPGGEYLVCKASSGQIQLVNTVTGNHWAEPASIVTYSLPTPLSRLVGSKAGQFRFKE